MTDWDVSHQHMATRSCYFTVAQRDWLFDNRCNKLFFFSSCQKHLAMAPWGATDGRATVPLDPVEDGKFGQQPFFHSKKRTAEQPNHKPSSKYLIELRINYTREPRNCLRNFACTRQQLPAESLYINERMHRMRRKVAKCVELDHKNSRKWIGELLISIN